MVKRFKWWLYRIFHTRKITRGTGTWDCPKDVKFIKVKMVGGSRKV